MNRRNFFATLASLPLVCSLRGAGYSERIEYKILKPGQAVICSGKKMMLVRRDETVCEVVETWKITERGLS